MSTRIMYVGTVEYLDVTVTNTLGVPFNTQPVAISIDGGKTFNTAAWQGTAGPTRTCSLLIGTTVPLPAPGAYDIRVQITDSPEIPIIDAGTFIVSA